MKRRQEPFIDTIKVHKNLTDDEEEPQGPGWRVVNQHKVDLASIGNSTWGSKQSNRGFIQRQPSTKNLVLPKIRNEKQSSPPPEIKIYVNNQSVNYFTSPKRSRRSNKMAQLELPSPKRKRVYKGRPKINNLEMEQLRQITQSETNFELENSIVSYRLLEVNVPYFTRNN